MPLAGIALGTGLGGGTSATSGGAAGGGSTPISPYEQAVIDLGPSFWVDASYPNTVKSEQTPVAPATEANATNGQEVSKWISRVGTGIELVQADATERPIFNSSESDFGDHSTITFDATADTLLWKDARYVDTVGNVGTIFYVGKELSGSDGSGRIINWSTNGSSNLGTNHGGKALFVWKGLVTYGSSGGAEASAYMAAISLNGSSSYFSINEDTDVAWGSANASTTADVGYTSVGGYGGTGENTSTQAAEYIIFNTALSPTDVAVVETYLKDKYEI
tara:strand:- start:1471 stop:2301 length:831 start_codon:yes stop_codon:yes gene_type:complete